MKVSNIKDIDKFFAVVDSCEGRVELVTGEGDRFLSAQDTGLTRSAVQKLIEDGGVTVGGKKVSKNYKLHNEIGRASCRERV